MIICFRWKNPALVCFQNCTISLFDSEANLFLLVCRIKGAAGKYPFRKEYEFSRECITQITHQCFRYDKLLPLKMQSSLVPHCFWGKSALFYNNMVAMVTIETPGFKPKRWLTLDKNFLVPSAKMSIFFRHTQFLEICFSSFNVTRSLLNCPLSCLMQS